MNITPRIRTRLVLSFFAIVAFAGPFTAVYYSEKTKQLEKARTEDVARIQTTHERYQYYLELEDRRQNLRDAMTESKNQYEKLLAEQPEKIKDKQTTVSQTVVKPVVTNKVVEQKVAKKSAPKSSTKTKSS